jgi:hypothetical protein
MSKSFARVYAVLLLTVSYGWLFTVASHWDWQLAVGGIVVAFFFAAPVYLVTKLVFAVCGK